MKKAKIVLTVVGLFAIAGGALAFKAARNQHTFYKESAGKCTVTTFLNSVTTVAPAGVDAKLSTTTINGACPTIRIKADA